jgi:Carboxypeptidase regulatory-like domain
MRKQSLVLAICFVLLAAMNAFAQRSTANIRGTVTDSSGAVIPGATVALKGEDTGLSRTATTNAAGVYSFPDLPVGRYRIDASLQGFKAGSVTDIVLSVADDREVNFQLEAGSVSETVTVQSSAVEVRTIGGEVSGLITGTQVRELPLNGRNFLQLTTLMPGVSLPDSVNTKDKGLTSGSDLSVSGSDVTANMWTVDGANNNDVGSNRTILVYPSLEVIEEFKILRNSYGPEFGGAGGAQINIVTRSGTNTYHGSAFYSGRNDALNSTDYFLDKNNLEKGELSRHDFGGSFGGPLVRDKLHFFGGVEWNLEDRGTTRSALVPTQAERNGDFSQGGVPDCSPESPIDPLTGSAFPGNRIPANRISPAGQAMLNLYPLPNVTPALGSCNNWVTSVTTPLDWNQYHIRGDYNLSAASRIMVRYTQDGWKNGSEGEPSANTQLWGDDDFPGVDSIWDQPAKSFVASLSQTFGSSATNTIQFSYSANSIEVLRGGTSPEQASQLVSLIPPLFGTSGKYYGSDISHPVWWGGSGYEALWNEAPFNNNQDLYVLKDDYTKVFGKHFLKAGMNLSWNVKNEDSIGNGSTENANFWGAAGVNGWGSTTGNVLSDWLLRDMTWGFSEFSAQRSVPQRWRDVEFYVADSWQASPRLTLDYGFRYSIYYNSRAADNKLTSFQPSLFDPALGNDACNGILQPPGTSWCQDANARGGAEGPNDSLMDQDVNNIAPRIGMAWDVRGDGKTAVRAGIGQFFLRERLSPTLALAARNPPFVGTASGIRKLDTDVEPCDGCFGTTTGVPAQGRAVDQKTPNNWQWNLMVQHELWRNTTLEVGYVGNYGYDQLRAVNANQVVNGDINHNGVDDRLDFIRSQSPEDSAAVRPFGVFGNSNIAFWDHSGKTNYNSLQTQLISRIGRGSQFQVSYTLARSRANTAMTDSGQGLEQDTSPLDVANPDLDWGRPAVGRTHIFNSSLVWMLPYFESAAGLKKAFLGDWEISAIVGAATGQPVNVRTGGLPGGLNGGPSGTGYTDNQRPNRTGESCEPPSGAPPEQIINPAAYTLNGFQLGTNGNAERGECDGPGYFQTDLAFYKNFRLANNVRIQFRWDIFNLFNNTNFMFPGLDTAMDASAVVLNSANVATATAITSATIPTNFLQATRVRDPRQMQLGFKILW